VGRGAAVCNQLKSLPERLKEREFRMAFQKTDEVLKEMREASAREHAGIH
jgi:hypothetical protein